MYNWREFSTTYRGQKAFYTEVSNEYADYCSSICIESKTGYKRAFRTIKHLVGALEEIVLKQLSPTAHDGTD